MKEKYGKPSMERTWSCPLPEAEAIQPPHRKPYYTGQKPRYDGTYELPPDSYELDRMSGRDRLYGLEKPLIPSSYTEKKNEKESGW